MVTRTRSARGTILNQWISVAPRDEKLTKKGTPLGWSKKINTQQGNVARSWILRISAWKIKGIFLKMSHFQNQNKKIKIK